MLLGQFVHYKFLLKKQKPVDMWKLQVFIPLWCGYIIGGLFGTFCYDAFSYWSFLIPAITLGSTGILYLVAHTLKWIRSSPRSIPNSQIPTVQMAAQEPQPQVQNASLELQPSVQEKAQIESSPLPLPSMGSSSPRRKGVRKAIVKVLEKFKDGESDQE